MELKNKNEIMSTMNKNIDSIGNNIEFEVRYGKFIKNNNKVNFKPSITVENFINICNYMANNKNSIFEKIEYSLIVNHKDGSRVSQILDNPYQNEVLSYPWKGNKIIEQKVIKKECVKNIDDLSLGIRFSFSKENLINDVSILDCNINPAVYFKSRKRITYTWENVKIDISIFKSSENLNKLEEEDYQYEVELEVINRNINFEEINNKVESILKIVQDSFIVMTNNEIENIKKEYFNLSKKRKFIGCQPETLKLSKILKNEDYTMTLKLDGKRHLLFIYDNKCYLIDNKLNTCRIDLKINNNCNYTVIDGELVNNKYYCFDILYKEKEDIRYLNFNERYAKLKDTIKFINNTDTNTIILKEYIDKDIYNNIIKYIDNNGNLTDNTIDGFILVPINKAYSITRDENIPLKWKPEIFNTIDFKIKKINKYKECEEWLLLCSDENGDIPFLYDNNEKLSKLVLPNNIATNFMDNTVIEFYYDKINEQFYPYKTRYDKLKGNYIKVAQDNFDTIMYPFKLEILKNLNKTSNKEINEYIDRKESLFFNMRRFHNWIKRQLLEKYSNKSGNLLDLACGKGGDIQKWVDNNIRYVEGYDINNNSINEAINRYNKVISKPTSKNFEFKFEVKDLSTSIVKKEFRFDLITCFFAIHYFYKSKETLENFIENLKNLKEDSYIIITTLCCDKLKEIDYTSNSENLKISKVKIDINKKIGNSIKVFIKDTVLNEETLEYIVDYEYTINLMREKGFELVESKLFSEYYPIWKENGNFLSYKEREYSFLNRTYIFKKSTIYNKENTNEDLLLNRPLKGKNAWTLKELKELCKKHNIDPQGKKEELFEKIKNRK